jgi:hypothetical protein
LKVYRVARWLILAALILAVVLMLRTPAPIATPMSRDSLAASAQSFQRKLTELAAAQAGGQQGVEVRLTAGEVSAALSQANAAPPSADGEDPGGKPSADPYQVSFEDDVVRGQFTTVVKGKELWVTLGGHVGVRDGYVTFTPTEFRIGSLWIPVGLVNGRLQQKLLEEREKLKLPAFVSEVRVERGELVVRGK